MHRKATDMNLVSCNFTKFIYSNRDFLGEALVCSMCSNMQSANSGSFTSSPSIWIPFFSFYYLIAVVKTFNAFNYVKQKWWEWTSFVLFLILEEMLSSFSPLCTLFAVDLSCMAFAMLKCLPSVPALMRAFITNGYMILFNCCQIWLC